MNSQSTLNIFYRSKPSTNIHLIPEESVDSDIDAEWYPEYQWLDQEDEDSSKKSFLNCKSLNSVLKKDGSFKDRPKKKVKFKKLSRTTSELHINKIKSNDQYSSVSSFQEINNNQYLNEAAETIMFLLKQGVVLKEEDGCIVLPNQLFKVKSSESFISSHEYQIQDQIIQSIHNQAVGLILNEIGERPYSLILHEVVDGLKGEQVAFIIRYVDAKGSIQERFLEFYLGESTVESSLKSIILSKLKTWNLSTNKLISQSYEGTHHISSMSKPLARQIKEVCSQAAYVHYSAHSLSMSLRDSCSVFPEVRNVLGVVNSLFNFMSSASKEKSVFRQMSKGLADTYTHLNDLSKRFWISRKTSISDTKKTYEDLLHHLKIINSQDRTSHGTKAKTLLNSIRSFEFILVVYMLDEILNQVAELSKFLQESEIDVIFSQNTVKNTIRNLQHLRNDSKFEELYVKCSSLAKNMGVRAHSLSFLSIVNDSQIPEDLKYHSLFFQLIDLTIDEIKFKFQDPHLLSVIHIAEILRNTNERSVRSLKELNVFKDLINFEKLEDEMECWQTLSKQSTILEICKKMKSKKIETQLQKKKLDEYLLQNRTKETNKDSQWFSTQELFHAFNKIQLASTLPQIDSLFRIYLTIPITVFSPVHSHSVLKRIKLWLRSTMAEKKRRSTKLALLNIERDLLDSINMELIKEKLVAREGLNF